MCLVPMKIKSSSPCGVKYSFVPCGKCAECRRTYQSSWYFRLAAELGYRQKLGWHIGFFTLTYNDEHLPFFSNQLHKVRCFRKSDVRRLIFRLRKQYHKQLRVKELVYLIASEFGEVGKRPHYHGIIAFPSVITPSMMLHDIKRYWSDERFDSLGFVFPSFEEYADEKFVCKSVHGAALYASKYCCKDLAFEKEVSVFDEIDFSSDDWKNAKQFHIQSRSLGLSILKDLSDDEKYDLYVNGLRVIGSDRPLSIPLYIKNKIFFNPLYIMDDKGNRLVRRSPTIFLKKYAAEIWEKNVQFYDGLISHMLVIDFWKSYGFEPYQCLCASATASFVVEHFGSSRDFAEYFVSYFGVPYYARLENKVESWLLRYEHMWFEDNSSFAMEGIDLDIDFLFSGFRLDSTKGVAYDKMRDMLRIKEFHNNLNK